MNGSCSRDCSDETSSVPMKSGGAVESDADEARASQEVTDDETACLLRKDIITPEDVISLSKITSSE